jgi:hypothetical protein
VEDFCNKCNINKASIWLGASVEDFCNKCNINKASIWLGASVEDFCSNCNKTTVTKASIWLRQGWQKSGQYEYWPGRRSILVKTGQYWSIEK